jgi:hypothetical protein
MQEVSLAFILVVITNEPLELEMWIRYGDVCMWSIIYMSTIKDMGQRETLNLY